MCVRVRMCRVNAASMRRGCEIPTSWSCSSSEPLGVGPETGTYVRWKSSTCSYTLSISPAPWLVVSLTKHWLNHVNQGKFVWLTTSEISMWNSSPPRRWETREMWGGWRVRQAGLELGILLVLLAGGWDGGPASPSWALSLRFLPSGWITSCMCTLCCLHACFLQWTVGQVHFV